MSASCSRREGYPASVATGLPITGLDEAGRLEDVLVFHSGTTAAPVTTGCGKADAQAAAFGRSERVLTAGGRVLTVVGRGRQLSKPRSNAPTRRSRRFLSTACSTAATSDERH